MDTIYVGFRESDRWTKHFLKEGFGHCLILVPRDEGWLEIEPVNGVLQFNQVKDLYIARHYSKVIKVKINQYKFKGIPLKFFTCVNIVQYALGKNLHVLTPYQLYKKLTGKLKKHFNTEEIF